MGAFTSKATGNWDAEGASTWNEANHPAAGDTVTIQNGHVVSIKGSEACGNVTIDSGGTLRFDGAADSAPAILTLDNGATLANSGTIDETGTGSTGYASLVGTSLEQLTGTNITWGAGYWHIAQIDFVPATTTGGGGCTITIDDDVKFTGGLTLTAGDTMACTTQDTNIDNGDHWFAVYGTLTLTGVADHPITVTKDAGSWDVFNCIGIVSMQYVTITDYCLMMGGGTIIANHTLDNVSVSAGDDYGIYVYGTSQTVIATNCVFSGGDDADWNSTDVSVKTGGSIILENCTYTSLGMNETGATWILNKTGNDFTIYGNLASSETPAAGYRAADITGNLTLALATKYGTPFNTAYTLGANCINANALTIPADTSLDLGNFNLTASLATSLTGTLTCGSGDVSLGSGMTASYALTLTGTATFTGGSGNHTIGTINHGNSSNLTFTSGNTTLDSYYSINGNTFAFSSDSVFSHGSGTLIFTRAGTQLLFAGGNTARSFYNLIVNNAACLLKFEEDNGFHLTVANDLTITAGEFDTSDITSGTSRDLTVTNLTSVTGTLTCNASTCSFGSGVTNNFALTVIGTFTGGSGTHTMGSFFLDNGTATFTSGVTTLDSRQLSSVTFGTENGTFNHGSGTITFTMANYQLIYDLTNTARTFYNLIINKASNLVQFSNSSGYTLTIANDFTITSGEFDTSERTGGASRNLIITGNLSNADTFTCNSGLVTLNGTTQTLTGSWTFWSFTKSVGAADTLTFDNTGTYTFGGNVTLNGASGELLSLLSDSAGNAFDFVMSAGAVKTNLSYLSVKDSDASGSDASQKPIAPTNSTFVSGNTDWESSGSVTTQSNQTIYNKYYY